MPAVSGRIVFGARVIGGRVRRVVFAVDGRRRWSTKSRPFRYRHSGILDTRKLHDGAHVLLVKALYRGGRVRVARRRIVVHNVRIRALAANRGPVDVGVLGPPSSGVGGSSVALFNRQTFQYSSSLSTAQEAARYQVIVLQQTDAAKVASLHAGNPNLKVLLYQEPLLARPGDPLGWSVCSQYPDIQSNHPDWLLKDQNGNPIPDKAYPGNYLMDVGNPAYQQSCAAHATAMARQGGFDGVYFDDFQAQTTWTFPAGVISPRYPNPSAWQSAMYSMITYVAAQSHAQGLLAMGNIGGAVTTPGLWQQWSAPLDGAEEQAWNEPAVGRAQQLRDWPAKLANVAWSEAHGKLTVLGSYDTTEAGNTFGVASMMLIAGGHASYCTSNANLTSDEAWYPEYDTAQALGAPAGPYRHLSNGVYERAFAHGIVLVNPTSTATAQFSLGGGRYTGTGLASSTAAAMAPKSGLILRQVA